MATSAYLNRLRVRQKQEELRTRRRAASDSDSSVEYEEVCSMEIADRYANNLKQQISCLDTEASYLAGQAERASRLEPLMRKEAQQMASRLRMLEKLVAALRGEIERKAQVEASHVAERNALLAKLEHEKEKHAKEKGTIKREIREINKEIEFIERQLHRRRLQMEELEDELREKLERMRISEQKVAELREQYHAQCDKNKQQNGELKRKRSELVDNELKVKREQDEYTKIVSVGNEVLLAELKDKILNARIRMSESEKLIQADRDMQTKLKDENKKLGLAFNESCSILNALKADLTKLQSIQEEGLSSPDTIGTSRSKQDAVFVEENRLVGEVARLKESLILERARNDELTDQVKKAEETLAELSRKRVKVLEEKQEVDAVFTRLQSENRELADLIAEKQEAITDKDDKIKLLEDRIVLTRKFIDEECNTSADLWSEIERHGDTLRHFGMDTRRAFQ